MVPFFSDVERCDLEIRGIDYRDIQYHDDQCTVILDEHYGVQNDGLVVMVLEMVKRFARVIGWLAIAGTVSLFPAMADAGEGVDFVTQVMPIFQQHCVRCHSPGINKGDVSLATIDDLLDNDYIIPGESDASPLIDLIVAGEGDSPAMPQQSEPLSDSDVQTIRDWIDDGAKWPEDAVIHEKSQADETWWSLQPIRKHVSSKNSIDEFVREKLAEHGLRLSPIADRRTLIRRLTFNLHGLPPSPEAVEAFVSDSDPQAYSKLVDRLLDSPHYGERYARHWLDIAHYADTHGFERDKRRDNAWRYRDYVIAALNDDKPYDRFLQEQICGDVLRPNDPQAVIATGFLASGPWDFVGHAETKSEQLRRAARALDLDDMVTQVLTATMAMTVNCARCHDHKLDPISQQEYYQLQAVFAGVQREDRIVSERQLETYENDKAALTRRLGEIDAEIGELDGSGIDLADLVGGGNGHGTGTYRDGIDVRTGAIDRRDLGSLGPVVTNQFTPSELPYVDGVFIPDGRDGDESIVVSSTGITVSGLPSTSSAAWDLIRNGPVASQHSTELGGIDFTKQGHSVLGIHANAGITFDLDAIRKGNGDHEFRFTAKLGYFGASGSFRADAWVFVDGRPVAEFRGIRRDDGLKNIDAVLPRQARFLTLVSTDGGNGYGHDQVGFGDARLIATESNSLSISDQQRIEELRSERVSVSKRLAALPPPAKFYGISASKEMPQVHVLTRGDPESPRGEPLAPAALGCLTMLQPNLASSDSDAGQRRVALANWITHPDNPLTPRVIVNRLWQWHFGQGIVDTASDFGFGGGQPSHPELLDWLATELSKRNGSLKAMHRLILNSQTYKQQSKDSGDMDGAKLDAENRLLWHQNPRRIEAEAIRDAVLCVSGKLNFERGGPGFEDFEYREAYAPIYTHKTADRPELWRRSIYRFIVRTTPNRFLSTLDCPDPANMTPKRSTTTTPLQSLALLNNDFMLRQARYFAERIQKQVGDDPRRQVERGFELAFARKPSAQEAELAKQFVRDQTLFSLCRMLLNANEFVYVD
ncbi:protein containing DUF1549 [Rhodopirellula maiorica SM1]|uniref:Protein containing DUF1549 n=1 Tax=Rhodopirellula maiorica SM1 TaxID=1265738 RepID=M5S0G3_9BACT|nr:DUF1553 domain-containing protein [Rhodopirellula maiorica]EMI21142.1 protein containing DUF1549 [Rhodopirellula maiorica SM1]